MPQIHNHTTGTPDAVFSILQQKNIITTVQPSLFYHDEPRFHYYTTSLNKKLPPLSGIPYDLTAGGVSFTSSKTAMMKCVMEAAERFCLFGRKADLEGKTYHELKGALDPYAYLPRKTVRGVKFRWVRGLNLMTGGFVWIPAQLANLNRTLFEDEPLLTSVISTGASAGFDRDGTVLRGIYEVVERDAFMTVYLNRISAPRIPRQHLGRGRVRRLAELSKQYHFELSVYDITNDLGIPSYLSLLVDRRGGPFLTMGVKSDFDSRRAVEGSIEEAYMARPWLRYLMDRGKRAKRGAFRTREERGLLWSVPSMEKHIRFLLESGGETRMRRPEQKNLSQVIALLKGKGRVAYTVDLTLPYLHDAGVIVQRVLIPGLQPLYLFKKEHNMKRLRQVSRFFGQKKITISAVPHPFL